MTEFVFSTTAIDLQATVPTVGIWETTGPKSTTTCDLLKFRKKMMRGPRTLPAGMNPSGRRVVFIASKADPTLSFLVH